MDFIQILKERGFVHQFTDEEGLRTLLKTPGQRAYVGYDLTGPSLHVGHLLPTMALRWFQKCGHQPVVLLGGGTTKIGDPSGKDTQRQMLTEEVIAANEASIATAFDRLLGGKEIRVNNADWLDKLNYIAMLREVAPHFSVNRMLTMDSVRLRLEREQPLSFLEFNYMILQAYDFAELYKEHGVRLQLGGSDQWGNILCGISLHEKMAFSECSNEESGWVRSKTESVAIPYDKVISSEKSCEDLKTKQIFTAFESEEKNSTVISYCDKLFGATMNLITTASGAKMGKTAAGAVWLNADLLKPYDYWQFWRNTEDADVGRFLKLFTELELPAIDALLAGNINDAKVALATEATALMHGAEEAEKAAQTAREIFAGSGVSDNLPTLHVAKAELDAGIALIALVVQAGFAASNGEARRLIKGNGVKLNDAATTEDMRVSAADLTADGYIKLSAGKKRHVLIKTN
ncbi:MAG: tyrosine--tRNA ligase [Azospirillum brasilense]|nr:MAG: tyrosine--tRNA ligase [Azospirillum brasilense]